MTEIRIRGRLYMSNNRSDPSVMDVWFIPDHKTGKAVLIGRVSEEKARNLQAVLT